MSVLCLTSADIKVRLPKPVVALSSRNIRSVDAVRFDDDFRKSLPFTQPGGHHRRLVNQINGVLKDMVDKTAPVWTRRRRLEKPITEWISSAAVDAKRTRHRFERRRHPTRTEPDLSKYRPNKRVERATHYRQRIQEAGSDHKHRWQIVSGLLIQP